ncbi:glycosyltransferase family 2 protein [Hyunsoonleella pacifica]|uniref:Glycosyltransferase n=1 Tax=Hyunsoonleella pacifica TaxID=1080224 RepID=A0A4Q9FVG3_9FLAO|nr:glycosyltransferase [Hyunsoonleella pacifica]TBN18512.1 glycosyltransferase [Hyunsoonleella pacifica]GGD02420.1 hypothetical protein GCM10011368_00290 [Hyunsoonleella pacifica]
MITVILTYRNRELKILDRCLRSLSSQTCKDFNIVIVDYGSRNLIKTSLGNLLKSYVNTELITCETQRQLWCKSRAINIALKQCQNPFVFIGDVDMIFRSDFIEVLYQLKDENEITYFQVGFLNKEESTADKEFNNYKIGFKSKKEATGMTLYPTKVLKSINGYDEFYNGWGSEDTDVHTRMKNSGVPIYYYTENILMLHQWHEKFYRTKESKAPYHSKLEEINSEYLKLVSTTNKIKANLRFGWGKYCESDYEALNTSDFNYSITNKESEVKAFINNVLLISKKAVITVKINPHKSYRSFKYIIKKLVGKKTMSFLNMQEVNDTLLEIIIMNLRDKAYKYSFDKKSKIISLKIKL